MQIKEQLECLEHDYLPAFLGYAIKHLHNFDEAEELAQEIALRSLSAIRREMIGAEIDFHAYMWRIARNTLVSFLRPTALTAWL